MMSAESDRAIAMAVNPVSGESNSRRQRSEPRVEHHVGAAVDGHCVRARSRSFSARRPKVRFGGRCIEETGSTRGALRHRTGDVLADRVDDADGMMGVRHPLTSTGAVRICTGKTE